MQFWACTSPFSSVSRYWQGCTSRTGNETWSFNWLWSSRIISNTFRWLGCYVLVPRLAIGSMPFLNAVSTCIWLLYHQGQHGHWGSGEQLNILIILDDDDDVSEEWQMMLGRLLVNQRSHDWTCRSSNMYSGPWKYCLHCSHLLWDDQSPFWKTRLQKCWSHCMTTWDPFNKFIKAEENTKTSCCCSRLTAWVTQCWMVRRGCQLWCKGEMHPIHQIW